MLKTPVRVLQSLPSPPHSRQESSLVSLPSNMSHPTCCKFILVIIKNITITVKIMSSTSIVPRKRQFSKNYVISYVITFDRKNHKPSKKLIKLKKKKNEINIEKMKISIEELIFLPSNFVAIFINHFIWKSKVDKKNWSINLVDYRVVSPTHHAFALDANVVSLDVTRRSIDHPISVPVKESLAPRHAIKLAFVRPSRIRDPSI